MAKILVAVSGLKGMLFSSFGVIQRLEDDGHQVVLGSPKNVKDWTEKNGFTFLPLPNIFLKHTIAQRAFRKILSIISVSKALEMRVKDLKIDDFISTFEAEQFDLLLCDVEMHEIILAAHKIKLKTLLLSQWFNLAENHQVSTIQSLSNPKDKSGFSTEWTELKEKRRDAENVNVSRKQALMEKAKDINFPTNHWQQYTWPPPFVYVNLPTISLTLEQLDFYREDEYFHYVGPTIFTDRKSLAAQQFPNQYFLSKKEKGSKIILVTVSTLKTAEVEFLEHFSIIAKSHPDWEIIINSTSEQIEIPENLHLFDFIPQLEILNIADLSINHGGIHTINECIHFKVPMIIIPGDQHDQNGCAARCFYHGIAIEGKPSNLEACMLNSLSNTSLKSTVQKFHRYCHEYQKSKRLEEIVNQFLMN